ncbi:MAG: hypothetical protein AAFP78_13285 [Pseudomonadota bacterium]
MFRDPKHPYTRQLIEAAPDIEAALRRRSA